MIVNCLIIKENKITAVFELPGGLKG